MKRAERYARVAARFALIGFRRAALIRHGLGGNLALPVAIGRSVCQAPYFTYD